MTSRDDPTASALCHLAVDSGQTASKIRLLHGDAPVAECELTGVDTSRPLLPQLASITAEAMSWAADVTVSSEILTAPNSPSTAAEQPQHAQTVGGVALGVSGLTEAETRADLLHGELAQQDLIQHQFPDSEMPSLWLTHDSVTSYLGALGEARGVVVAAGTGVVTLAVGQQHVARVDGWGSIMGDAGSGFWIGRQVLQAVMRAYDGRGPATALTDYVTAQWPALDAAYIALQNEPQAVSMTASFARYAAELAAGDDVAAGICSDAAAELAHSALTALRRSASQDPQSDQPALVVPIGGVFGAEQIRAEFLERVRVEEPHVQVSSGAGQGIDGAQALFSVPADHPLRDMISTTERT